MRMRGTFGNGGTSAHQASESIDSSSPHNFRGGDSECKQTLFLSRRSRMLSSTRWCRPIILNAQSKVKSRRDCNDNLLVNSLTSNKTKHNVKQGRSTEQRCSVKHDSILSSRNCPVECLENFEYFGSKIEGNGKCLNEIKKRTVMAAGQLKKMERSGKDKISKQS